MDVGGAIFSLYDSFRSIFPSELEYSFQVFVYAILITLVALFIWRFYKSLSRRTLIKLNLNQYNTTNHPSGFKILAILFYFIEYLIIMPFLILLWFAGLSIIILLIAEEGNSVNQILLLTAAMVTAIRILAYHNKEIAQDLAKLFPFITLSVFLLSPNQFKISRITEGIGQIPLLLNHIFQFVIVIIFVEVVLRVLYTIMLFWKSDEELRKMEMESPF